MADAGTPKYLWMDGEVLPWERATVHASHLGWSTMGAVFEGIKAYWNADADELFGWQLAEHYARFATSMRLQRMRPGFTPEQLVQASCDLLRANECRADTYVRAPGLARRRHLVRAPRRQPHRHRHHHRPVRLRAGQRAGRAGLRLLLDAGGRQPALAADQVHLQLPEQPHGAAGGHPRRLRPAHPAEQRRKVTEGPAACVFIVRDGVAVTPSLTSGILESITRTAVLRFCRDELGVPTQEREIDRTELYVADEVFFCGTGAEIAPVGEVDHYRIGDGAPGPITGRIESYFHGVVRGRSHGYAFWRTPVYAAEKATAQVAATL